MSFFCVFMCHEIVTILKPWETWSDMFWDSCYKIQKVGFIIGACFKLLRPVLSKHQTIRATHKKIFDASIHKFNKYHVLTP